MWRPCQLASSLEGPELPICSGVRSGASALLGCSAASCQAHLLAAPAPCSVAGLCFLPLQRWGLTDGKSVEQTEADLKLLFPQQLWKDLHLQVVMAAPHASLRRIAWHYGFSSQRQRGSAPMQEQAEHGRDVGSGGSMEVQLMPAPAWCCTLGIPPQRPLSNAGLPAPGPSPAQIIYLGREHCPAKQHDPVLCPVCSWAAVPPYNKVGVSPQKAGGSKNGRAASSGATKAAGSRAAGSKASARRFAGSPAPATKRSRKGAAEVQE